MKKIDNFHQFCCVSEAKAKNLIAAENERNSCIARHDDVPGNTPACHCHNDGGIDEGVYTVSLNLLLVVCIHYISKKKTCFPIFFSLAKRKIACNE